MGDVLELSRTDARRLAVRAQLLTADRPTELHDTVSALTLVQAEPTAPIAPSADLVLWSRLGASYDVRDLREALDDLSLVLYRNVIRPAEDMRLYRAEMEARKAAGGDWVHTNNACRLDILELLRTDGPLPRSAFPDTCVQPWKSSGWNDNRNVRMMLDLLVQRGEVAAAGQEGREALWDLAERIYPDDEPVPLEEAFLERNVRRLRSVGIARPRATQLPVEPVDVGEIGQPAVIDGVKGKWRVDPDLLEDSFEGRVALLSPFDRLLADRKRMEEIFEFEYVLEMYKPVAQRRWGYYALPVLHGDRLVGKLDATADRKEGEFRVDAVHWDVEPTEKMRAAVDDEIEALASWTGLPLVRLA